MGGVVARRLDGERAHRLAQVAHSHAGASKPLSAVLVLPFLLALPLRAEMRVGETVVVKVTDVVEHNLYASGARSLRSVTAPKLLSS